MSSGQRGETGALPIGVLLAADGAVRGSSTATLTPPGGVRYPSAWEQESAPPLPRREPLAARTATAVEERGLPRRRDLRGPGRREHGTGGLGTSAVAPRAPHGNPAVRPQFPATLPPGVVRLDEPLTPTGGLALPSAVTGDGSPTVVARHDRLTVKDDATRALRRPARRTTTMTAPNTGSLDIDADLFTPASERLARQTPSGGISARHTPSAGLALGRLQAPAEAVAAADPAPVTPANGIYPRRRDLRRHGGTVAVPPPPQAPAGLAFLPSQATSPCSGEIPLGTASTRRRDLRLGGSHEVLEETAEPVERTATERTGAIAVGVARAAVMTMLVGVGYAVVSGHQLTKDFTLEPSGTTDAAGAMIAGAGSGGGAGDGQSRVAVSEWDARGEVAAVKAATEKQTQVRVEAAKAAAVKVQAAKAAAAARAAQIEAATRDAQRNPKAIAKLLAAQRGWGSTQFTCLDLLWTRESNWNYRATNASSGAYGIAQSLPGGKMASVGADWRTNPVTQIKWGLNYIADRYGTPCGAWAHSQATGWY